jgi:hypothetical protein
LLKCHELHAHVPNRRAGTMSGTDRFGMLGRGGRRRSARVPSSGCVHFVHTGVHLVTRVLARVRKGHILLS